MTAALEVTAVSKHFGRVRVLNQAWLHVHGEEVVGLIGCNGAGKTTLLRLAAGLLRPDGGTVRWHPTPPVIRYFAGEATLPPEVRARQWAAFFGGSNDDPRRIGQLSRGTRQLLGLRTMMATPPAGVLLLDEPWDGLDPPAADWLSGAVRTWAAAGAAVVISSHRLHDLDEVATRFVVLEEGRCQPLVNVPGARVRQLSAAIQRR